MFVRDRKSSKQHGEHKKSLKKPNRIADILIKKRKADQDRETGSQREHIATFCRGCPKVIDKKEKLEKQI